MTSPIVRKGRDALNSIYEAWPIVIFILSCVGGLSLSAGAGFVRKAANDAVVLHEESQTSHPYMLDIKTSEAILSVKINHLTSSVEELKKAQLRTEKKIDQLLRNLDT